jgi:hypothetical protein
MNVPIENSRPAKLTHAQTILYEIDMLRFAAGNFARVDGWNSWCNLECFLLHFRNLIEFFGKPQPRQDDLSIQKPDTIWPDAATRPSAESLRPLHREDLWQKYEGQVNDKISRYLQHCTEERLNDKSWKVREMFGELFPLIDQFEKALPDKDRPWKRMPDVDQAILATMEASASTATVTKSTMFLGLNPIVEERQT